MFAEERIRKIKETLLEYEHVDINTLTSLLDASITTVRRDLDRLEREGFLTKAHGGAILNRPEAEALPLQPAVPANDPESMQIAALCAQCIEPGDRIYLGSGQINRLIARNLQNKRGIQVVTNNLSVAQTLFGQPFIKVFVTGGDLDPTQRDMTLCGHFTNEQLSQFYFSKAFLCPDAVSLERGYSHSNADEIPIFRSLIAHTKQPVAAMESSRFDTFAMLPVCPFEEIKTVMTGVQIPDCYKEVCFQNGIRLYTSFRDLTF